MIVTEFQYALENKLLEKIDLMIERCSRDKPVMDSWLINEGAEGCLSGSTIISITINGIDKEVSLEDLYKLYHGKKK